MSHARVDARDDALVDALALVWGEGFLAPGGAGEVQRTVGALNLLGKRVLDIGSGLGGASLVLASRLGAGQVTGIDVERGLVERARHHAAVAGMSDRIEFRLVQPGPLPFEDEAFDMVFTGSALARAGDKCAMLADIRRVLLPGGWLLAHDWMKGGDAVSEALRRWLEREGLSSTMERLASFQRLAGEAGFTDVVTEDASAVYRALCRRGCERMHGPLRARVSELLGTQGCEQFIEDWRAVSASLDGGGLRAGRLRGCKP